jgi:hypothetical protein
MKLASFFVALLVGAPAAAADPDFPSNWTITAPAPQHTSCERFGSAYTGKSGKSMSMGKSGKGLETSKSSKANSEQGLGKLRIEFSNENGQNYYIVVNNVHHSHCAGELMLWLGVATGFALSDQRLVDSQNGTVVSKDMSLQELGLQPGVATTLTWVAEHKAAAIISEENGPVRRT